VKKPLIVVAASGLAREVIVAARAGDEYDVIGLVDDDIALQGTLVGGVQVLGGIDVAVDDPEADLIVCVGSGRIREVLVRRLTDLGADDERFAKVIDPRVVVPGNCVVGAGTVLLANVVLTADVTVGRHVVAMPGVVMTHDDVVGDYATLCAGVALGGGVHIGPRAYIGMNASVRQGVRVGAASTLGMGSVLLRDVPDGQVWGGVPASELAVPTDRPQRKSRQAAMVGIQQAHLWRV
jgi:sugar O-acyltransferase (sialic acid O-acetyltransferase NeuD family)